MIASLVLQDVRNDVYSITVDMLVSGLTKAKAGRWGRTQSFYRIFCLVIDCHPFVSPRVNSMKLFPNSFHPQRLGKRPRNNTSVLVIQAPITTFGDRCDKLLKLAWTWSFYSSINLQGIQCAPSYVPHDYLCSTRRISRRSAYHSAPG